MTELLTLASISGEALVWNLVWLLGILGCVALLWGLARFIAGRCKSPPVICNGIDIVFAIVAVIVLIVFILGLVGGKPLIT